MGRKKTPGLIKRGETWHVDKRVDGVRIAESTGTGCREHEICQLRWEWEIVLPELNTSVFIPPDWLTKNNEERVVVLNPVTQSVINSLRGKHPSFQGVYLFKRL